MSNDEEKKVPGEEQEPEAGDVSTDEPVEQTAEFGHVPDEAESEAVEIEAEPVAEPVAEPEPEPMSTVDNVLDDVKEFLSSDDGGADFDLTQDFDDDLDDLMKTKRSNISLVIFLLGLFIVLGVLGYILVNDEARTKVAAFVRGDLFEMEEQRAEDLQKLYLDKLESLGEKYGDIRLQYFPRDSRVHIFQTLFRYDDIHDKSTEQWGDRKAIPNVTKDLKDGEELPYLSIENLPVREKGMLCVKDGQFYPASTQFCPGFEECREKAAAGDADANEQCITNALKSVQYCPQDDSYYVEDTGGIMVCPDGKTLMDPAKVPIFVHRYEFLFQRKDFISQVVEYMEQDWIHLGSGKYIIPFPKDFALNRAWGPVKKKYASARKKMRCWRTSWEDHWDELKRGQVLALVREKRAEKAKKKEEKAANLKNKRLPYQKAVAAIDIVRKVKTMATIRQGMAEVFYYCPEIGKCAPTRMPELKELNEDAHWGLLVAMKNSSKKWPGLDEWLATRPIARVGLECLQKWIPGQKEGQFVEMKDKDCLAGLESVRALDEYAYTAMRIMFLDPNAGTAALQPMKADIDGYLQSVDEYTGAEKYEDLLFRMDSSGRFLEYLLLSYLYDFDTFNNSLTKFAQSRQINYRRDAEKRGVVPSDVFRGLKDAMEMAWWTGSKMAFDTWYWRLWQMDVQGCLLFIKELDPERYKEDLQKFEDMVGREKEGMRAQARQFKDFLKSLRHFAKIRPQLKEAYAMYKKDKKAFFEKYPESVREQLKTTDPLLYDGLLYIANPKAGKKRFEELSALPEVKEWETPKKPGDQAVYHKYLAYMDVFAPSKLEKGMAVLANRMVPMFMSKAEYELQRDDNPDLPGYRDAIRDIVNHDIHLKYFWVLKLLESPSKFKREFSKLDLREAREVAKWVDPERYVYLSDLAWNKEMISRYGDAVPVLMDALTIDFGLYNHELKNLKGWCKVKSKLVKKYRRGRLLANSLLKEPSNVLRALDKGLKMANRFALLAKNLEDYEEAVLSTMTAGSMEELRDTFDSGQTESYAGHVETNNEKIRLDMDFNKKEWESLTKEFEKTAANAEWYSALQEGLKARRLDCSKVDYPEPEGWTENLL
jgi:hypothetical protein